MRSLSRQDLRWALRRAPQAVLKLLKERPGKVFAGGGFVRSVVAGEQVNDVDLFACDEDMAWGAAQFLEAKLAARVHKTDNAYTVHGGTWRTPVQVIRRWTYDSPERLMESFDFTVAMAGFWWQEYAPCPENGVAGKKEGWQSICDDRFYEDLAAKRLRYTSPQRNEDAGGSLLRVLKFYQRGYRIPLDSLGAVVARLAVDVKAFKILEGREPDRERQLAKVLTGLLREVDPNIDPSHIAHLPSGDEEEPTDETTE